MSVMHARCYAASARHFVKACDLAMVLVQAPLGIWPILSVRLASGSRNVMLTGLSVGDIDLLISGSVATGEDLRFDGSVRLTTSVPLVAKIANRDACGHAVEVVVGLGADRLFY